MLFAQVDGIFVLAVVLTIVFTIGYLCYCLYMMTNHPQEWAAMQQRAHERRLHAERLKAMENMQKAEEQAAARQHRNGLVLGIGSALLRAFFRR